MQKQQQKALSCSSNTAFYIVGLLAVFVYVNTLIGDFTFDDNFAVITNGDVTNNDNPVSGLFKHDFWGQDITSSQSHKSYRPVTILAFRITRQAWDAVQLLVPGINGMLPSAPQQQQQQQKQKQQSDTFGAKSPRPAGLHAFPFHVLSVALHALVSMLVLALVQHLFAKLEMAAGWAAGTSTSSSRELAAAGAEGPHSSSRKSSMIRRLLMWQNQPELWLRPVTWAGQAQALAAAVLFALHPAHTEAVAGVVGCAELICAAWSIPALLLYFMAVDGRYAAAAAMHHHHHQQQRDVSTAQAVGKHPSSKARPHRGKTAAAEAAVEADAAGAAGSDLLRLAVADGVQHWLLVLAAAGLAVLAALSKEIGITITGTMVLYDLLLAPHMLTATGSSSSSSSGAGSDKACQGSEQQQQQQHQRGACRKQMLRVLLLAAVTVGYIKLRSWVAVQQLVAIYRKVENPIPFADSFTTRLLSTGFLHARYFGILLFPRHLSADWSFSCIPLVEQLSDPRNAATAALYLYFLYVGLAARPLLFLRQLWGVVSGAVLRRGAGGSAAMSGNGSSRGHVDGASSTTDATAATTAAGPAAAAAAVGCRLGHARWRLMVMVGLLVAPYFPASNVLFYVGTFIGERLLYFPSIGYCLLLADLLGWLLQLNSAAEPAAAANDMQQEQHQALQGSNFPEVAAKPLVPASADTDAANSRARDAATSSSRGNANRWSAGTMAAVLLVLAVCCGYAARTVLRNADWWDEERLFLAAERVCPNSAKVQQNCGVLQRRYANFSGAMQHFKRAQEIEPGYCEPSYWIALTRINQGEVLPGIAAMRASLGCKYTAAEALQTLNRLYVMMHENNPGDPMPMLEWAGVLASRDVLRVADGCATAEDAALMAALAGKSANYVSQALDVCTQGLEHWEAGGTPSDTLASLARDKYSSLNTTLLRQCVSMRRAVYKKLTTAEPKSQAAKKTLYKYISKVQQGQPGCRTLAGGGNAPLESPDESVRGPSSHQKLLHRFQSADPEDPWLQLEWGATLLALGGLASLRDAAMHLEVSSAIFNHIVQELQPDSGAANQAARSQSQQQKRQSARSKQLAGYTALDGKTKLTPIRALEAAMLPLEQFKAAAVNATSQDGRGLYCEMLKRLCHLRLQMVVLVQQLQHSASNGAADGSSGANGGGSGSSSGGVTAGLRQASSMKALLAAKATGRRCLVELSERRGCEQQAEEIRRLIGRGTD